MMRRLLMGFAALVVAWCLVVFAYGIVEFPAYPYKPCAENAYCDKLGRPHSRAEFEALARWNRVLAWSWPIGVLAVVALQRMRSGNGRRIGSNDEH